MSQENAAPGSVTRFAHACARFNPDQPANADLTRARASSIALVTSGPHVLLQLAATGPGPQPPSGVGREPLGLQGSQHDTAFGQPRFGSRGPTEHVRSFGQQVGKQYSVASVQYFHFPVSTFVSHVCAWRAIAPRACGAAVPAHVPTSAAQSTRNAPRRCIGCASVRASSSRSSLTAPAPVSCLDCSRGATCPKPGNP